MESGHQQCNFSLRYRKHVVNTVVVNVRQSQPADGFGVSTELVKECTSDRCQQRRDLIKRLITRRPVPPLVCFLLPRQATTYFAVCDVDVSRFRISNEEIIAYAKLDAESGLRALAELQRDAFKDRGRELIKLSRETGTAESVERSAGASPEFLQDSILPGSL